MLENLNKVFYEFGMCVSKQAVRICELESELAEAKAEAEAKKEAESEPEKTANCDAFYNIDIAVYSNREDCRRCENVFKNDNYFYSMLRLTEIMDKINFLLKLERLHDIYCPDYAPDWENTESEKWYVVYDTKVCKFTYDWVKRSKVNTNVYFPSGAIAREICGILNSELSKKQYNQIPHSDYDIAEAVKLFKNGLACDFRQINGGGGVV